MKAGRLRALAVTPAKRVQAMPEVPTFADAGVPFKATAGLHHAIRGEYPLTYAKDSPRGEMFGYLNVFIAAAIAIILVGFVVVQNIIEGQSGIPDVTDSLECVTQGGACRDSLARRSSRSSRNRPSATSVAIITFVAERTRTSARWVRDDPTR